MYGIDVHGLFAENKNIDYTEKSKTKYGKYLLTHFQICGRLEMHYCGMVGLLPPYDCLIILRTG